MGVSVTVQYLSTDIASGSRSGGTPAVSLAGVGLNHLLVLFFSIPVPCLPVVLSWYVQA